MDGGRRAQNFLTGLLGGGLEAMSEGLAPDQLVPKTLPDEKLRPATERAAQKTARREALAPDEQFALEAIIIPDKRPAIDIVGGDYQVDHPLWMHYASDPIRTRLRQAFGSIGRIELPNHPSLPYGGWGFVVGPDLLMTNRHVAELFSSGLGQTIAFRAGLSAGIDFLRERDSPVDEDIVGVTGVLMIHPFWDMALLRVSGLDPARKPLTMSLLAPEELAGRDVAVVGYPAFDPRNAPDVQNTVFRNLYNVKRLQPGKLTGRGTINSFDKDVPAATHDSSTLGGNSGSAVIDATTGYVVGLHFAGVYLKSNYAVPTAELGRDARVVDTGLAFERPPVTEPDTSRGWWVMTEAGAPQVVAATASSPSNDGARDADDQDAGRRSPLRHRASASDGTSRTVTWTLPLEVTVRLGDPSRTDEDAIVSSRSHDLAERMVEPEHDDDLSGRRGYDARFLGVEAPLPEPVDGTVVFRSDGGDPILRYEHFSLAMHKARRLALFTASNLDLSKASRMVDGRIATRRQLGGLDENDTEKWFPDPRVPAIYQLPDRFFTKDRGAFDKGHIVRREDVAYGADLAEMRRANGDTFHTTNCSPQVAGFNRPHQDSNWGDLEKYVTSQARQGRLSLFAGPILADDDPVFVGVDDPGTARVKIPRRYWKVALAIENGGLQAFAFILEQDLADVPLEFTVSAAWRSKMVSIAELEAQLGNVRFAPAIHRADQADTATGEAVRQRATIARRTRPGAPAAATETSGSARPSDTNGGRA